MSTWFCKHLVLLALLCCGCIGVQAQDLQSVPPLTERVIDRSQTLSASEQAQLIAQLRSLEQQTGVQAAVLMLPTTAPEDIAEYAQRVAETWKLGRRSEGDGLVIVVAKSDRKVRIQIAKALEGSIPDLAAARIIQSTLTPAFQAADYAGGLTRSIDALRQRIQNDAQAAPPPGASQVPAPVQWSGMLLGLVTPLIGLFLILTIGRKLSIFATGGLVGLLATQLTQSLFLGIGFGALAMGMVFFFNLFTRHGRRPIVSTGSRNDAGIGILSGISWGSGGGFSSGGGGFSSGGGGDFGGGGASGDW
jgi:uncharacterized protein